MKKIYIDIDGVLLTTKGSHPHKYLSFFIEFITANFDCYWLTTHCKGNAQTAIAYLAKHLNGVLITMLKKVKPTNWNTLKTEAIDFSSDYYWFVDYVLCSELEILKIRGHENRLIQTNGNDPDTIIKCLKKFTVCKNLYQLDFNSSSDSLFVYSEDLFKLVNARYISSSETGYITIIESTCGNGGTHLLSVFHRAYLKKYKEKVRFINFYDFNYMCNNFPFSFRNLILEDTRFLFIDSLVESFSDISGIALLIDFARLIKQNTGYCLFIQTTVNDLPFVLSCFSEIDDPVIIKLDMPDSEIQKEIIKNIFLKEGISINLKILDYIISFHFQSIRELEGIVYSIISDAQLKKISLTGMDLKSFKKCYSSMLFNFFN